MLEIQAQIVEKPHGPFVKRTLRLGAPRENEVLVRLVATGICHTDLAIAAQYAPFPLPAVLGHEGAGIVEQVGPGVAHVAKGDNVVLTFAACGDCLNCESDHDAYCHEFGKLNLAGHRADGTTPFEEDIAGFFFGQSSFADYAVVNAASLVKVRDDVDLRLLGPLGCGVQTGAGAILNVLKPHPQSVVVVCGVGAVGAAGIMAAKLRSCHTIVAVDRVGSRLDIARQLGASLVVDTSTEDLSAVIDSLGGVDVAFDTTGNPDLIHMLIEKLRSNGTFAFVGGSPRDAKVSVPLPFLVPGRKIMGITEGDSHPATFIPHLVDLYAEGRLPLELISKCYPFDEMENAVNDARSGVTIKPILIF